MLFRSAPAPGTMPAATILVLGDSLSAEYGIPRGKGWVALLADKLQAERPDVRVVNASISGDTTAGGLARLPALLDAADQARAVAADTLRLFDEGVLAHHLDEEKVLFPSVQRSAMPGDEAALVETLAERLTAQALAALQERDPGENPATASTQADWVQQHALIRGGDEYADLFTQVAHSVSEQGARS